MDGDTFNLSVLFDNGAAIGTIVCYSEQQIDRLRVQQIVNQKIYAMIRSGEMAQSPKKVVDAIAGHLSHVFIDMQTVVVPTHACVSIMRTPLRMKPDESQGS